jgi:FkbM family methyltransferase
LYVAPRSRNPARNALRYAAWHSGEAVVSALSRVRGFRVPDDALNPFSQNLPMLLGTYERQTVKAFRELVRPGMTVVDGGAHVGYLTRIFASLVGPRGRVLAVEAHPGTAELLRQNTAHLANVTVAGVALGSEDGSLPLYAGTGAASASLVAKPGLALAGSVPVQTLASLLDTHRIPRVDFLKLDVEGAEPDVLAALPLAELRPFTAMIEVKRYILEARGTTPEAVLLSLLGAGYRARIVGGANLTPADLASANPGLTKANVLLDYA